FARHVTQAGLPKIRYHDLRHTQASLMLAAGVHPKVASERLGHHSTAFTLDVYTHVVPGMQQQATETVAGLILPDRQPETGPALDSDDESQGLDR
ncbi:MAG TPA: tyrosine-type recombinase/integrase, partial [Cryptosporangiaceae bacterium]|nr:tyrosine-type recombinase/integrase [Cryptosporangiaceae bacterium]